LDAFKDYSMQLLNRGKQCAVIKGITWGVGGQNLLTSCVSVYTDQVPDLYCLTMYATYNKYNQSDKLSWLLLCT